MSAIVWALAVAFAASGAPADEAFGRGLLEMLVVGMPLAAGLYALRTQVDARFGIALLVTGFAWSLTALAEASESVPYTIGRLATWLVPPSLYFLLLVFPEGRLRGGLERALLAATVALAVVLFFGSAFFVEAYPLHTPWATCVTDCPANALFVLDDEPAVMQDVVVPLREWLLSALLVGLVISLVWRWRAASVLRRRTTGPVVALGAAMACCLIAFYATRQAGVSGTVVETLGAVWTVCVIGIAAAFLYALFRRRLQLAEVLARLSDEVRNRADASGVHATLSGLLGDPSLELFIRDEASDRWRDGAGREVARPDAAAPGRVVTIVGADHGGPAVAMIHDVALCDDRELLKAVGSLILAGWRHERVLAGFDRATAELEESRRRLRETAGLERARIERDLHDGAQQRLIALRIRLSMAEQKLHRDPAAGADAIHELGVEAERALQDLRALALGAYPSVLEDHGLEAALRALTRDAPMPVHVTAAGLTRHGIEVESAVYYTCVEAIQNATKHARTATGVWVDLTEDHGLRFEVRDDGAGFTPDVEARGLRNMRDRIEAVGGALTVQTAPGRGTRIAGAVATATRAAASSAAAGPSAIGDEARAGATTLDAHVGAPRDPERETDSVAPTEQMIYERLLPAEPNAISRVRRELHDVLERHGVPGAERSDIALTVSEAATNVVQHAYRDGAPGPLSVTAALRGHTLVVSVVDEGRGMRPPPDAHGAGLGLALMTRLADEVEIVSDGSRPGTAVHATFENVTHSKPRRPHSH